MKLHLNTRVIVNNYILTLNKTFTALKFNNSAYLADCLHQTGKNGIS